MRSVTGERGGTAYSTFSSFPIEVAGKTGTATASSGSPNAWFVGFAPYHDPEIAVVCVIEHGGHAHKIHPINKERKRFAASSFFMGNGIFAQIR